jgi:hypothetical protein
MHHVYDKATGLFTGNAVHTDNRQVDIQKLIEANFGEGFAGAPNVADPLAQRVDVSTGQVVDFQPPSPGSDHEWNPSLKRWVLTAAANKARDDARVREMRMATLNQEQHTLIREVLLNPTNAVAREALTNLHAELATLERDRK